MTETQTLYSALYAKLSKHKRDGTDCDGNQEADEIRTALFVAWEKMTPVERQLFFAPQVIDRHMTGPVNPDFRSAYIERETGS